MRRYIRVYRNRRRADAHYCGLRHARFDRLHLIFFGPLFVIFDRCGGLKDADVRS